jgi:hypothetical protein
MDKDRTKICEIISEMLDNPNKHDIYPTSTAFTKLEHYIEGERFQAIGWTHAFCCSALDKGTDPRVIEVPKIIDEARSQL